MMDKSALHGADSDGAGGLACLGENNRRFPDRKPDPVFRVARHGKIVECGAAMRELFETYDVVTAQ